MTCWSKKKGAAYTETEQLLKRLHRYIPERERIDLGMYKCKSCGEWHVGHDSKRKSKRQERYELETKKRNERYGTTANKRLFFSADEVQG